MERPHPPTHPGGGTPGIRPPRRLSARAALAIEVVVAVVAVALGINLMATVAADIDAGRPASQPPGAGPGDTPVPPIDSQVDDFAAPDGSTPGRFPDRDDRWEVTGPLATADGVLVASGPGSAAIALPEGDKVVQAVVVRPADGWRLAFAYAGPDSYWAVELDAEATRLVRVDGDEVEEVARAAIGTPTFVETIVVWRDGEVHVRSGGASLMSEPVADGLDPGRFAVVATRPTASGVDSVAIRPL